VKCCCYCWCTLGFSIFLAVVLAGSPEVSEISCGKVMWYNMCICACQGFGSILILTLAFLFAYVSPDDVEVPSVLAAVAVFFFFLWCVTSVVNCSLLLEQVLNISSDCQRQIEEYNLFWVAVQIQAYSLLGILGLIALNMCCSLFIIKGLKCIDRLKSDGDEHPSPVETVDISRHGRRVQL